MDFNSLKNTDNLKAVLTSIGKDVVEGVKSLKDFNAETFKTGFNTYFVDYLKNSYLEFEGRVSRHQYWMFALYSMAIGIVLELVSILISPLELLSWLFIIAIAVPSVGLGIRRLHDVNLSGWFFLIAVVPYIGVLALVLLFCLAGDAEDNKFGPVVK